MMPVMPTGFTASTKRAFGPLCWWDTWLDEGRPSLTLNRIPTSGQVPGALGEQRGGSGVPATADAPQRPFAGLDA